MDQWQVANLMNQTFHRLHPLTLHMMVLLKVILSFHLPDLQDELWLGDGDTDVVAVATLKMRITGDVG